MGYNWNYETHARLMASFPGPEGRTDKPSQERNTILDLNAANLMG